MNHRLFHVIGDFTGGRAALVMGLFCGWAAVTEAREDPSTRGRELYERNCLQCHQANGSGVRGIFPPLAGREWSARDIERAIRVVCEGASGPVVVNGVTYDGVMPPVVLGDGAVADVLTHVLNSWGNPGGRVSARQVREVRSTTKYPTAERQALAMEYPPLPAAPAGFTLREVARLPQKAVRMASDGTGREILLLSENGDVRRLDLSTGAIRPVFLAKDYLTRREGDLGGPLFVLAMTFDRRGRLLIAANQQDAAVKPAVNTVTIYRTTGRDADGSPADPRPWFEVSYPGRPSYIHAVEHMAIGPDGMLYVGNGARTDGGFSDPEGPFAGGGETPITACLWRLDPEAEKPEIEVYARGIRNAYGFCWNDRGEMILTENGPDADAPEELNLIERGRHYGFPYQYSDWDRKAYERTPDPPEGLKFTKPIPNLGPDGGFNGSPVATFDPHSCPGGIVFLGDDFPEGYRGTFIIPRFGNMIRTPGDTAGFDVLRVALSRDGTGDYQARVHTLLKPLGRPIDVHLAGRGRLLILEYSRGTRNGASYSPPGRVLELAVANP